MVWCSRIRNNRHKDRRWCQGKPPHYGAWTRMIERCFSEASLKRNPQYAGVSICQEWSLFSEFEKWSIKNFRLGWTLDKDVIDLSGILYSPRTCCYLPQEVNKSILDSGSIRSEHGLGVWYKRPSCGMVSERARPYVAEINNRKIGTFPDSCSAHRAWQIEKSSQFVSLASEWYGIIDDRAIVGLLGRAYLIELDVKNRRKTTSVSKMEAK